MAAASDTTCAGQDQKPPTRGQCAFYLKMKGRYCRMLASRGTPYCCEHMLSGEMSVSADSKEQRIACPLDPSHTVDESLLKKHLKKCNAAKRVLPNCYSANVNSGLIGYSPSCDDEKAPLSSFSKDKMDELLLRVDRALTRLQEPIECEILYHSVLQEEIDSSTNGTAALKHLKQQSSIIGQLDKLGLLVSDTYFIEFGAGKGKLSHWIQLALTEEKNVHFLLIDRANCKRKFDIYHRFETQGPKFERLLIDIEHFDLKLMEEFQQPRSSYNQVIGVGKHLCGTATDLTLRCLTQFNCKQQQQQQEGESSTVVTGILISLCCHQRCEWRHFFGRDILQELGFDAVDFHIISHMTSWSVCGERISDESTSCHGYRPHPKESIGIKCKRLLDFTRVYQLKQLGYDAHIVQYVDRSVSLENMLIVAVPSIK